jgi:hypothetical protein
VSTARETSGFAIAKKGQIFDRRSLGARLLRKTLDLAQQLAADKPDYHALNTYSKMIFP